MHKILLILQHNSTEIDHSSLRLCANIKKFARQMGAKTEAVVFGSCREEALKSLGNYGISRVYQAAGSKDNFYAPERRVEAILELFASFKPTRKPTLLALPGTLQGREIAPLLACRLEAGFVDGCVELGCREGKTEALLNVYNGQYQMLCEFTGSPNVVLMADVNRGAIESFDREEAEIVSLLLTGRGLELTAEQVGEAKIQVGEPATQVGEPTMQVVETFYLPAAELDIAEADIVVGIGRGVQSREDFRLMQELAASIGAPVGGSRPAVDAGWLRFEQQIGQTGRIIAPELYLAAGISGAQQHISGVEKAKIIAINNDPQAPILRLADLGAVGDFQAVVPLLLQKLKPSRKEG